MEEFITRENQIFEILQEFTRASLNYILIGGYAVSAFKHRFSIDADVIIKKEDKQKFVFLLRKNKFVKAIGKTMPYVNFEQFTKKEKLPISVDLLIGGVASRQTNAVWNFDFVLEHSIVKKIKGIEKEIKTRIPETELLIATKLHSARLTDCRDIVALATKINKKKVVEYTLRGDKERLRRCLKKIEQTIEYKDFIDAFKGVFSIEAIPTKNVQRVKRITKELQEKLSV